MMRSGSLVGELAGERELCRGKDGAVQWQL